MFYIQDDLAVDSSGLISESKGSTILIETRLVEYTSDAQRSEAATKELSQDVQVPNGANGVPDRIVKLIEPVTTFDKDGMQYREYHIPRDVDGIAVQGIAYAAVLDRYAIKRYKNITYLTAVPVTVQMQTLFDRLPIGGDMPDEGVPMLGFDHFTYFKQVGGLTVGNADALMIDPPLVGRVTEYMPVVDGYFRVQGRGKYLYPDSVWGPNVRSEEYLGIRITRKTTRAGYGWTGRSTDNWGVVNKDVEVEVTYAHNPNVQSFITQSFDICGDVKKPKVRSFDTAFLANYFMYLYGTNKQAYRRLTLICHADAKLYHTKL